MRRSFTSAIASIALAIGIGWAVRSPGGAGDSEVPAPIRPEAQSRPHHGRAPHATAAVAGNDSSEVTAPPAWPAWATDDLGQVVLVAPHPSEVPWAVAERLLDQPERHRAETQTFLAREALDRLLAQQGLEGAAADDLRAQMQANFAAMGWE